MNKTALKNFATWARRQLIESVSMKAQMYKIEKDKIVEDTDVTLSGNILTPIEKQQRAKLIEKIHNDGFDETVEEVAYTWFNRFIAIRFMEVNGYLPSHIRAFSAEDGSFNPQILTECMTVEMESLNKSKVIEIYNTANKEELFKYLFIAQCNELGNVLPGMFEKISDYTELLIPDGLLKEESVIRKMVEDIPEEDWKEQVQIIGWLFQFYNTDLKNMVYKKQKKAKTKKEEIPAATQFFTPDWIVKYMVENSLGRLWVEGHPNENLKSNWKYYLEEAEQEPEVEEKLKRIREEYAKLEPKDIKCIDPAMGSGHILCYLFDVLIEIYESYGYKTRDAAKLIIENNIYGLDIDERAKQLAYFSIMMKARQYDRRFLAREEIPQPNVYVIDESNDFLSDNVKSAIEYFKDGRKELTEAVNSIISDMIDAKEYGSIINVKPVNFELIYKRFEEINAGNVNIYSMVLNDKLLPLVKQAEILSSKYDIVVTNPPYMGRKNMNSKIADYLEENYSISKMDLYATFILRCHEFTKENRYYSLITQFTWMYLKSFEYLRINIINDSIFCNICDLGTKIFEDNVGTIVKNVVNINLKYSERTLNYKTCAIDLSSYENNINKENALFNIKNDNSNLYNIALISLKDIPDFPFSYWTSKKVLNIFKNYKNLSNYAKPRQGMASSDNKRFLRHWFEVEKSKLVFNAKNSESFINSGKKWAPYNKGGDYRKWYGNNDSVINWELNGKEVKDYASSLYKSYSRTIKNEKFYFRNCVTYTFISEDLSVRHCDNGFIFDVAGSSVFFDNDDYDLLFLALLCSKTTNIFLKIMNPTYNKQVGDIKKIPINNNLFVNNYSILQLTRKNIELSKFDWDMHETSWDFVKSPLLLNKKDGLLQSAYESYKIEVNERFEKLKENEEELNRIFIDIYGLQDELTPEVSDKDITVAKIFDNKKDIYEDIKGNKYILTRKDVVKNFLSYFVGCYMGRYSLDYDGLAYAGGEFDSNRYKSFKPDDDGILPITSEEYFEDDIVRRLEKFLKVTFGEEHLNENLDFIASELKGKVNESSGEKIRNYFMNDFYKDHCKMYHGLPIYWLFDSGKLGGSRNLVYMHRYKKDTVATLRIRYVFEIQDRYKQELKHFEKLTDTSSGGKKVEYQKKVQEFRKLLTETEKYEEKVQHIADSYIEIDLDDGVKENYSKFKDILAKIKKG